MPALFEEKPLQHPLYIILLNACQTLPERGGIATYTHELADHLGAMGHAVTVLTYPVTGSAPPAPENYRVERFPSFDTSALVKRGWSRGQLLFRLPPKVFAMARDTLGVLRRFPGNRERCVLWAVTWWPEALAAFLVSSIRKVPYVVTAHGSDANLSPSARRHFLYKRILNASARVFAVSSHTAECLRRCEVSADRLSVVHNGVRPEEFALDGSSAELAAQIRRSYGLEGKFALLTIARLYPRKGHLTVLSALAGLRERIPELHYVVVGKGSMKEPLEQKVRELSLEGMVTFTGEVSDQVRTSLLHACDLFVMPNRDIPGPGGVFATEGFGIVFLEASACAKPVIAGRAGGAPEVVVDGTTGFLVDPENPEELMERILRLRSDRNLAHRLGLAGRQRVESEFTWKRLSLKYLEEMNAFLPSPDTGTR